MTNQQHAFANLLYGLVWVIALALLYLLRKKEVEQLWIDYMGFPAFWALVSCSGVTLWATWSLTYELARAAIWLYNEIWPDLMGWFMLDVDAMASMKTSVGWIVRLLVLVPPVCMVIKITPWMARSVLELTARID
jgi:hypothetical protein